MTKPIRDYFDLRRAIAERRRELQLSQRDVDVDAGIADGLTSKIECGTKWFGDKTLSAILLVLKAELVLVRKE